MDTNELKNIGFVFYDPLKREMRDGRERMTWTGYIRDSITTVNVILQKGVWIIDSLKLENSDSNWLLEKEKTEDNFLTFVVKCIKESK